MGYIYHSPQIKWLVVRHALNGLTRDQIEEEIGIDVSSDSIRRWVSLFHTTGAVISDPAFNLTPGCDTKLTEAGRCCAIQLLEVDPTLILDEIARGIKQQTGIEISKSVLAIDLRDRLDLTRKVACTVHPNRSDEIHAQFIYNMGKISAECLIFTGKPISSLFCLGRFMYKNF
ncbi:uncharacterized protein MELLADRAFT_58205 [Melampsora larici-populina 98AG31]|uniref:Uncharacterized protein n=1 Tax=Melampsora larici-populina (strain 98AG31 / pathotype 3-4-7) TaxID=747676 RepID=F4SC81_MELLP|nr:uncharacterized protein MELLADRAFT_58205 [Melampsora larici-populina 98AG31]EGF97748.1 hypothetical protein MELLADRAFT_58205 [Melampsora larici-populina 98AG31]